MKQPNLLVMIGLALVLGPLQTTNAQRQFFSDFNDGAPDWDYAFRDFPPVVTESDGQLRMRATFPATVGFLGRSLTYVEWWRNRDQPIRNGRTLEYRVDLIRASRDNVLAGMYYTSRLLSNSAPEGFYAFFKDKNQIFLIKVSAPALNVALFLHEQVVTKHENVVLSMALTELQEGLQITVRVLDKNAREAVLFERAIVDTPGIDATVASPSATWNLAADPGPPYLNGRWHGLYLAQFTDGKQPEAEVVYDNFTYEYRAADPFTKITTGELVAEAGQCWGGAWGDFDDDGWIDLFVTRGAPSPGNVLFRNAGDGAFLKMPAASMSHADVNSATGVWGDADNDGDLDLFVPNANVPAAPRPLRDFFYRNNGDGTFTQVTEGEFVNDTAGGNDASWVDYDNDGFLDLFVSNGRDQRNFLYRNKGDGTFLKITSENPIVQDARWSHGSSWADYDNDGDPDLFVPNLQNANNNLYRNDGNGSFFGITRDNPIVTSGGNSEAGAWGDYDNDGDPDLLVVNVLPQQNFLFRNEGSFQRITDVSFANVGGYGAAWADYDNDGYLDLIIVRSVQAVPSGLLYRNQGDGTFSKINAGNLSDEPGADCAAWGDFDNDGFLDLFVTAGTDGSSSARRNRLYRNNGNGNQWIKLKLVGSVSNRSAIGAKVRVKATMGGKTFWQMREIATGGGFGKEDLRPNFGLGDAKLAETIRIEWPSGTVQELHNVPAKQILTITEPPKLVAEGFSRIGDRVGFRFHLIGAVGRSYRVEISSNLRDWQTWATIASKKRSTYLNQASSFSSWNFFRVIQE